MQQKFTVDFENLSELDKQKIITELNSIEGVNIQTIQQEMTENATLQAKGDTTMISQIIVSVTSALASGLVLEYFKYWLKNNPNSKININEEDV